VDLWFRKSGTLPTRERYQAAGKEVIMMRRRFKQTTCLQERIASRAAEIRAQAEALPPGSQERERMERKARLADVGAHMNEWLISPGLQLPR